MGIRTPNYNILAPFYDWLARIFIPSDAWRKAHQAILKQIPSEGVVWILGTGSGAFLREYKGKAHFVSIDPSEKMTRLAKKHLRHLNVQYIQKRHADISFNELAPPDVIISPFFMQLLRSDEFISWHKKLLSQYPKQEWKWFYTDFEWPKKSLHWLWQVPYLISMLLFMWIMTGKAIFRIKSWNATFSSQNYQALDSEVWANGLVWFRHYQKSRQ